MHKIFSACSNEAVGLYFGLQKHPKSSFHVPFHQKYVSCCYSLELATFFIIRSFVSLIHMVFSAVYFFTVLQSCYTFCNVPDSKIK